MAVSAFVLVDVIGNHTKSAFQTITRIPGAEFTQVDIEMSFVTQEDVYRVVESLVAGMLAEIGVEIETPLPRLPYDEAMRRYGSDRPDRRFGLEIRDVSEAAALAVARLTPRMALAPRRPLLAVPSSAIIA